MTGGSLKKQRTTSRFHPLSTSHDPILPPTSTLVASLTSSEYVYRLAACDSLSNAFLKVSCLEYIENDEILPRLLPLLNDGIKIKIACTGAIRNLCQLNNGDVINQLYKLDIFTYLDTYFNIVIEEDNKEEIDKLYSNTFAIISNIVETNEIALNYVCKKYINIIFNLLNSNTDINLLFELINLLLILTEENIELCTILKNSNYNNHLLSLLDMELPYMIKITTCSVLYHIHSESIDQNLMNKISTLLLNSLNDNHAALALNIGHKTAAIVAAYQQTAIAEDDTKSDMEEDDEKEISSKINNAAELAAALKLQESMSEPWNVPYEDWRQGVVGVLTSLELLTNICSLDEKSDEAQDSNWDKDGDDVNVTDVSQPLCEENFPKLFLHLINNQLVIKLLPLCQPLLGDEIAALNTVLPNDEYLNCIFMLNNIAASSLTVINNIVLIVPPANISLYVNVVDLFSKLVITCQALAPLYDNIPEINYSNMEVFTNPDINLDLKSIHNCVLSLYSKCTCLIWSISRIDAQIVSDKSYLHTFVNLARNGKIASIRVNCLGIVSLIAISRKHNDYLPILSSVYLQFLEDPSLAVVSDALNAIFDVFSEDFEFTEIISKINLTKCLNDFLPIYTKRVSEFSFTCNDKEFVGQLKETRLNLARFIKYLKKTYK